MKKFHAIGIAFVIAVAALAAFTAQPIADRFADPVCKPPRTFLNKDGVELTNQVDRFLEHNLAGAKPVYKAKNLAATDWNLTELVSKTPGRVEFLAIVGEGWTPWGLPMHGNTYWVRVVRDCAGGGWRVTRFMDARKAEKTAAVAGPILRQ